MYMFESVYRYSLLVYSDRLVRVNDYIVIYVCTCKLVYGVRTHRTTRSNEPAIMCIEYVGEYED